MLARVRDKIRFDSSSPVQEPIAHSGPVRLVLFCLEEGQEIPAHRAQATVMMQAFSGRGMLAVGDEEHAVQAGDVVVVPPGVAHAMSASEGRFTVLACIVSAAG